MAKDPAFLFYPNDWLGGTLGMTFEQKGAYMEVLMMQFNRGHMTSHMIGHMIGQLWDTIKDKFIQDDEGLWFNERLEIEQKKRVKFSESRRNNISGQNQHTKKVGHIRGHMTSHMIGHMENENINNNIITNVKVIKEKNVLILEREKTFKDLVFKENYDSKTLNDFFNYWSEQNPSKTKMRFELQKTWDLSRRLKTWNDNNFKNKNYAAKKLSTDIGSPDYPISDF